MNPIQKSKHEEANNLQRSIEEKALLEMHKNIIQFFDSQQIDIISLLNEAQYAYFQRWKNLTKEEVLTRMESFSNVTSLISNLATNQKFATRLAKSSRLSKSCSHMQR